MDKNSVYIIIEQAPYEPFRDTKYTIIGVTSSLDSAQKYISGTKRIIRGPVPILEDSNFNKPVYNFDFKPNYPNSNNKPVFNFDNKQNFNNNNNYNGFDKMDI